MTPSKKLPPARLQKNISLAPLTWWKIGGPASYFLSPRSIDELKEGLLWARAQKIPVAVFGGGSNLLIPDEGFQGLVLSTRELNQLDVEETNENIQITAEAGVPKSELTKIFLKNKLAPALFLCGLPGEVGGGVVMNAGVSEKIEPREFVEITDWIEVLGTSIENFGQLLRFEKNEIKWSYRQTSGWQPGVLVRAGFSWMKTPDPDLPKKVRLATKNRVARQPLNFPSCGSVFKNPPGDHAGRLIEAAGLKGFQLGGVQVSEKHANFIVNHGEGRASEVRELIKKIQIEIKNKFDIELINEVQELRPLEY